MDELQIMLLLGILIMLAGYFVMIESIGSLFGMAIILMITFVVHSFLNLQERKNKGVKNNE